MPLDPEALRVIALIREIGRPPLHTLSPEAAREAYTGSRTVLQPDPPEVAEAEDLSCPGPGGPVRLRRYRGAGTEAQAALPCLLFMHGGGWVIGDLESHDQVCRTLANYARCCVVRWTTAWRRNTSSRPRWKTAPPPCASSPPGRRSSA